MEVVLLAGGLGVGAAFLLGLAFASSATRVVALGAFGMLVFMGYHAALAADPLDPMTAEFMHATGDANALGWLAGTLLVARLRCLEWIQLHAQEAS